MVVKHQLDGYSEGRRKFLNRLSSLAVYSVPVCAAIAGGSMRDAYAKQTPEKLEEQQKREEEKLKRELEKIVEKQEKKAVSVPEPATLALVGLGAAAAVALAARKTKKTESDD